MTKFSDNDSPSLLFTEQGSTPTSPAASHQRLFIRTSDHTLCYVNSSGTVTQVSGGATAGTSVLLDYNLGADVTNQAITASTFFDVFANQNFTVASASSIVEIAMRGYGFMNDNTSAQYMVRANVDSGGTPILRYFSTGNNNSGTTQSRQNVLNGGNFFLSGLTAAVHTIKIQVTSFQNDHFYCRASTNGPTTGAEFLAVQVIEHKN